MDRSIPSRPRELDELDDVAVGPREEATLDEAAALPVVARLVVEIRSDGTRTIARGALEDPEGKRVAVEAQGTTPWALARQLAGALWSMPRLRRPSLRALLPGRRRGRGEG